MSNPQNSKLWAIYFLVMCIAFVFGLLSSNITSLVNSVLTGMSLVGLWGYMSQKAIGTRIIWSLMFVVQLLGAVFTLLLLAFSNLPLAIPVVAAGLTVPLLVALFRYAFRSNNIWLPSTAGA